MLFTGGNKLSPFKDGNKMGSVFKNGELIFKGGPKIVDFATGTDEEIAAMLEAHYKGSIDISKYWAVGDTRVVHINATNSGTTSHVAQNMTMVIMDFNHDDLSTPINGKTKAAVSVGFRDIMKDYEYYWGSLHYPVGDNDNYSNSPLRTWLNGGLLSALPITFGSLIKQVDKKNLACHSSTTGAPLITKDKIWLLSYPEVYGATYSFGPYLNGANPNNWEGTQYEYMKNSSNRIKTVGSNKYWLRSPFSSVYSSLGYEWGTVWGNGEPDRNSGTQVAYLAPAFCL